MYVVFQTLNLEWVSNSVEDQKQRRFALRKKITQTRQLLSKSGAEKEALMKFCFLFYFVLEHLGT